MAQKDDSYNRASKGRQMKSALASYAGKRVLVTGHTGFKGGWLTVWLKQLGADVIGLSLPARDSEPGIFSSANVADEIQSVLGDIRDPATVDKVFSEYRPQIVFHLAAQALVRPSYDDPVGTYATNVMGTVNILDAVRRSPSVEAVVNVTTDKCYENREWEWGYREADALGGHDPYSSSKACSELITAAYRKSFFEAGDHQVAVASARAGNVIGGGDWARDRLIPDIIRSLKRNEPVRLRNPVSVRPWQHVLESLSGYLLLGSLLSRQAPAPDRNASSAAQAWNFGPSLSDSLTVAEIADRMIELWGAGSVLAADGARQVHEASQLTLDCSKSRIRLGWQPILQVSEALEMTVSWYRKVDESAEVARTLTEQQIEAYSSRLPAA
jgi:CDP-glucose 4,6-dehydratase